MENKRMCRNCIYCPCTKVQCKLDGEACNDYESTVEAISKEMEEEK